MMLRRVELFPRESKITKICGLRPKFNEIVNEAAAKQKAKVMELRSCNTLDHFDRQGNLTQNGKSSLWYKINDLMERFEDSKDDQVTFIPRTAKAKQHYPQYHTSRFYGNVQRTDKNFYY